MASGFSNFGLLFLNHERILLAYLILQQIFRTSHQCCRIRMYISLQDRVVAGGLPSDITVRGVKTLRPMFDRLFAVTDLTVDYQRKARVSVSGGAVTLLDPHGVIGSASSVTLTSTGMSIVFPSHVTQLAIEGVAVSCFGPGQVVTTGYANKTLALQTYSITGATLNPITTPVSINIILSS
ncbi:hypothetical protein MUA03_08085 [Enterobacteriaceae bacterium H16N7]|nr:hypothetical protein [Dryocola clanedunensis]